MIYMKNWFFFSIGGTIYLFWLFLKYSADVLSKFKKKNHTEHYNFRIGLFLKDLDFYEFVFFENFFGKGQTDPSLFKICLDFSLKQHHSPEH